MRRPPTPPPASRRARRYSFKPTLEILEDRLVPSTFTWDGEAGDGAWFSAGNWSPDAVPGPSDDAVIWDSNFHVNGPAQVWGATRYGGGLTIDANCSLTCSQHFGNSHSLPASLTVNGTMTA